MNPMLGDKNSVLESGDSIASEHPELPKYAAELDAANHAHSAEFAKIVAALPLVAGQRVLDIGSGDGRFTQLLADRVGPQGLVIGADSSHGYLQLAAQNCGQENQSGLRFVAARLDALPFAEASFDFVWCAHSLASFPQVEAALKQMVRVVRPGGWAAVLENDCLHEVLLPWTPDLELAIRQAELDAYRDRTRHPDKRYLARQLPVLLANAGLVGIKRKTFPIDRSPPLSAAEQKHLGHYLFRLGSLIRPHLDSSARSQFELLADPRSPHFIARQPGFAMTWLETLCYGRRDSAAA